MSLRRLLPFLLVNVVVSALVVLAILFWWDGRNNEAGEESTRVAPADLASTTVLEEVDSAGRANTESDTVDAEEDGPPIHVVQPGDTLGRISETYDVSIEDIMTANDLSNPNFIGVGQQLIIPVGGIPTATPVPTPTPTPEVLPSPIPTEPPALGELSIEVAEVRDPGQLSSEAVEIRNDGSRQVALQDWQLRDQDGHVYTFGQVTLFGEGAGLLVHTSTGQDGAVDLFWGRDEAVWQSGELVTLLDAEGGVQAQFQIP